jgi:hypothetical protein
MIYTNTIPNNEIISNLNKPKTFASTNYWRILNKNGDKVHKNISASKMYKNSADGKILAAIEK